MNRISRRNFLKAAGVGAAALGLAACGGSSSSTASSVASSTAASSAAAAADVTIKVAAIETGYGADMWKKVAEAFTAQTGIKVDLTTDKKLEDVIGPSMQGGDYPDVVHLATGREAALTEQFIKGNLIADITDVLSMTVPGESKKVSEKIAGGFTDTSLTNPYGDGKTYLAPMFYSPCGLFYNAGFLKVKGACAQLKALDIPFEAHILSAHRTPAEAAEFAKSARANGFGVILCAAGMAAHLAGAFAANTTLPVIGIPMKGGAMDGMDALLATVQMPSGIPVATVALNGAKNAAWLAAEILALSDDALAEKLAAERTAMAAQIAAKEEKLQAEIAQL